MGNNDHHIWSEQAKLTLANNLILARTAINMTQTELADQSRISRTTIAQMESGEGDPKLSTIVNISTALGTSPLILFLGDDEMTALVEVIEALSKEGMSSDLLSMDDVDEMKILIQSGMQKKQLRAAKMGVDAAKKADFVSGGSAIGAAIGSSLLPGIGTAVGTIFGGLMPKKGSSEENEMDKLYEVLDMANEEERVALAEILKAEDGSNEEIVKGFWWNIGNVFTYLVGKEPSYKEIVRKIAEKLDVKYGNFEKVEETEIKIAQCILETAWEKMTPKQRSDMEGELKGAAEEFDKAGELTSSAAIFSALTAAQLSGFGIYLLASTSLGFLTGAIGIALPFAVYTTVATSIAVVIGPVGWIGAGLFAIWKLTGPNYKRLIPAVVYICALRAKLNANLPDSL